MSPAMSQHSNPHPYAITTTATGLLSRSSSTHSASAAHRFVPASPTRPRPTHSRPTSHSFGANELPRPLPSPPTLYRASDRRADALPSASQPDLLGGHRIDDPRTWSPADLSTYLSSASADLPPLAAHDLAAFVRTHGISGKKFLRLADGDLDSYGLDQRGLDALLRASRVLRQNSIRGRIWEDDDGKSALPFHQRGRTQSGSGRVKGMIASLERSASPTKSSSSASSRRSISPVKNLSDDSETKREPRLLPYPPSPASTHQAPFGHGPPPLLPQDTSSGVLSFSPQSTGSSASLFMMQTPPPPPQSFSDVFYTDPGVNARPLPFPPHSAQYYPSPPPTLLSAFDRGDQDDEEGMPLPRGMMVSDPGENIRSSTFSAPHVRMDQEHAVHNDSTIPSPPPRSMADSQPFSPPVSNEILAPRPHRHASEREAPKMLEEKLEELLEPRPRSRIVSHPRTNGSVSRPRSRVASMNGSWGRKHANGTPGIQKRESDGSMKSGLVADDEHGDDGQQQQPQRVRVISVSSRSHSHRLSGVEVWGETHPHYHRHHSLKKRLGIPFGEGEGEGGDEHDVLVADERLEDEVGKDENGNSSEEGEIGNIESVLEKSEIGGAAVGVGVEDGVVAVAKEPKSAVITVLETPEEESMEALLEREGVSGAEAWEMIGEVDTVKRVGGGLGKGGVGDVFSSVNGAGSSGGDSSSFGVGETTASAFPAKKLEEEETKCDQKEEEERELEKRVRETREMVEDARRRLENVEMWMERYERRLEKRGGDRGDRRDDSGSGRNDGTVVRVLRGFSTLFGFGTYYPRTGTTTTTQANGNSGGGRRATGRGRVVRLGIGLSSCVVLFGIGVCMVLLRVLGRRPVAGFGLGRMVGHWVVLNAGGGGRR